MRLFLALDLPEGVRAALRRTQEQLRPVLPGWRWIDPAAIHLTLRFLGEVPPQALDAQRVGWREAARGDGPVEFRVGGIGAFPPGKRPRVLWVGVNDRSAEGRLARLAARLEAAARSAGFAAAPRVFVPHLTIARSGAGDRPTLPGESFIAEAVDGRCAEVVLFQSELLPRGARYTRIDAYPLDSARGAAP